jgi:hypothetical protein
LVGILYYIRRLKPVGEEDEKLRDSAIETKKGRSAIAVAAQITTQGLCAEHLQLFLVYKGWSTREGR